MIGRELVMEPCISVIVPVYNTAKYLPTCLDSILSQSMPDFEIIAVNDASTDNSPEILAEYAARDARVRIVCHETNKVLLSVRLSGVRAARGKYLLFLDSDDCFLPGFLTKLRTVAEKKHADMVHFPLVIRDRNHTLSPRVIRLAEKKSRPFARELRNADIFRKYFVENAYGWSAVQKLYRTDVCRKAVENIPDQFCLMAEDFCFYTVCSFFAEHYVPMKQTGYVYFMDSGISSDQKTTLEKFLERQSPIPALRIVRSFLEHQNVPEDYLAAFAGQEQKLFSEYALRWMRSLPDEDRTVAFNTVFAHYDSCCLFTAMRHFFTGRDEHFLELLTGEDPEPVSCPEKFDHIAENPVPDHTDISIERWQDWQKLIRDNHYDTVILAPDSDMDRLFWDIRAVRDAGAAAVCRREKPYLDTLQRQDLKHWLIEDRVLRHASAVLTPDEASAEWYRKRNCHAGISLDHILPPQRCLKTSIRMLALEKSELKSASYRIDPSADGETFVPFFRKLDHLFRKLPTRFRKRLFGFLGRTYNRIFGF